MAIECDGEAYHSTDEQIRSDLDRQALLERMGWRFHRIRGSEFYRNPEGAIGRLLTTLEESNIFPVSQVEAEADHEAGWGELLLRIRARAEELRAEWWGNASSPLIQPVGFPAVSMGNRSGRKRSATEGNGDGRNQREAAQWPLRHTDGVGPESPSESSLEDISTPEAAAAYFRERGFKVEDKRSVGGALWVIDRERELAPEMAVLARRSLSFQFIGELSGWYLRGIT